MFKRTRILNEIIIRIERLIIICCSNKDLQKY